MTIDDHLRDLPLKGQVEALRSALLHTENELRAERLERKLCEMTRNAFHDERETARAVARELLQEGSFHLRTVMEYEDAHPWLVEEHDD